MDKYIMALDLGTTSCRCIIFDKNGRICSAAQKEFTQYFPQPGWVEHDAEEIWATQTGLMYNGRILVDVAGEEKKNLTTQDLLLMFEKAAGNTLDSDRLLLG